MTANRCVIDGCEKGAIARGWCPKHYQRWRAHGDPLGGGRQYKDPAEAFKARTRHDGECLIWTAAKTKNGYGQLVVPGGRSLAHRYAWERENGPIPAGMVLDHTCWNRACVNVAHLRVVTTAQNNANRAGPHTGSASGVRGVYPKGERWIARVGKAGRYYYAGTHPTIPEAEAAVNALRAELFGEHAGR